MSFTVIQCADDEEWKAARLNYVTASQAAWLFEDVCPPWGSREKLLLSKVSGVDTFEPHPSHAAEWGILAEPAIIEMMNRGYTADGETGRPMSIDPVLPMDAYRSHWDRRRSFWVSEDCPLLACTPDGCAGEAVLVEIKAKSGWSKKHWEREGPDPHYLVQCQHQLLVSNAEVVYLSAAFGGRGDVYIWEIYPDISLQDAIINEAGRFWEEVEEMKNAAA